MPRFRRNLRSSDRCSAVAPERQNHAGPVYGRCHRVRGASRPLPGAATILPFLYTTSPRRMVTTGQPVTSQPEKIENFPLERMSSSRMVRVTSGSQMTTSASAPTAITPFLGYSPKSLAGLVAVTATIRSRLIRPLRTPSE